MPNHLIFFLEHPFEQLDLPAGMHAEIAHQVLLWLPLPIAVPAGVNDENVAVLHFYGRRLDHFRGDNRPVIHVLRDVNHGAGSDQEIQWIGGHIAHAVGPMHRTVDMRSDMQRRIDALGDDHLCLQVLGVIHLIAGIADPTRRVDVHQMTEVDDFHWRS